MSKLNNWVVRKVAAFQTLDEEGQGLAEYGLILALIAVVCIGALTAMGPAIATKLDAVSTAL